VKRTRRSLLFPALAAVALALGCGSSAVTSVTSPTVADTRCQPSLDNGAMTFAAAGGTGTIAVSVARECAWSASSTANWIAITAGAIGQGDGTVAFRVSENSDPNTRRASISVGSQRADIGQAAAPCTYTVSSPPASFNPAGDRAVLDVRTQGGCAWQAQADADWAVVQPASGTGTGEVTVSVDANHGDARTVTVTVAAERITFTQPGTSTPPPPDDGSGNGGGGGGNGGGDGGGGSATIDLHGRIAGLKGKCPTLQFSLSGYLVKTTEATVFAGKDGCRAIKDKATVTLSGTLADPQTVVASRIEVDK
jgi:hypothetical protein